MSIFKHRFGSCETVGNYQLAVHGCLDGRQPTGRNVSSLTCRLERGWRESEKTEPELPSADRTAGFPRAGGRSSDSVFSAVYPPALAV